MTKRFFTATEAAKLLLIAYQVQQDSDVEKFEQALEKITWVKICEVSEQARLSSLSPKL